MALAPIVPGRVAPRHMLVNIQKLICSYYELRTQKPVKFGTSGHRGSSLNGSFNEAHILAITQAIIEYRAKEGITGPVFMGFDTHALSTPAFMTALEVLAANEIEAVIHKNDEYSPTPVISRMIVNHNRGKKTGFADGIIITPSHNGPADGGFKYNPPHGGPADTEATGWIQNRANELLSQKNNGVKQSNYPRANRAGTTHREDFITSFARELASVIDMEAIREAGIEIGADPMGGAGVHFWAPIAEMYGINLEVVNPQVEADFRFMTVDGDKTIRMDCSSPYAMAGLVELKDRFDIAFGNDTDFDRHGIVTKDGLMNPNHYLSVAIWYLIQNRPKWGQGLKIGKTLVSSTMIDKVVKGLGRELYEVPVGFKWFVDGLAKGTLAFGGEESAGASLLQMDGKVWTTDKDGFSLALLAAEIMAKTGKSPSEIYNNVLVPQYGEPYYKRNDGPITDKQKAILAAITPGSITATTVAGIRIANVITHASGNNAPMGGVKVSLEDGSWFAIRPSGTEPKMKLYVESFGGEALWHQIVAEANPLIFGA
ncbi:MAG: phosphoglucomutase (alpha-D-glucose-1,6-bisphosphate-dependent) [Candidatus Margulisiibacteriota bacterium]|nr:phosphoglucomutase (alpha-D-glucose-1,6-bisphosphate-dependent) [Candidatus Margulisiibacteriota bacterium]